MKKLPNKVIKEFSEYFDDELQRTLPISVLPDGSLVYKNFLIKQLDNINWGLYNIHSKDLINDFYFKSCALIAAKDYNDRQYAKYHNIKDLDRKYATLSSESVILSYNLGQSTDYEKHEILLARKHENDAQFQMYQQLILKLFRQSFI